MKKNFILFVVAVLIGSAITYFVLGKISEDKTDVYSYSGSAQSSGNVNISGDFTDFTYAAETSVKGVVFVKVVKRIEQSSRTPQSIFDFFFGYGGGSVPREQVGSGSGVIISEDGYIVTNNHVISGASEIEVTMDNNKKFSAKLIGTDPATDIALLKVEAENLPVIPFGDSDKLRLGEWVLAIGSPFGLTSTITAGIVSAKGRTIDGGASYDRQQPKIESFIQTDAAVNPGNSGGALVNIKGELVGINTAIVSKTGSYAGYSFAVPVNIVKKISEDFIEYGSVRRALLGIFMQNVTEELKEEKELHSLSGVYIEEVVRNGAADKAGVKEGDVLLAINSMEIKNSSSVQEIITSLKPGDKVVLKILRGEKVRVLEAELVAADALSTYSTDGNVFNLFGAELVEADKDLLEKLDLKSGVQVVKLENGNMKDAGIKEGFVITYVNNVPVSSPNEIVSIVKDSERSVLMEGVYSDGSVYYYGVGL